MKVSFYKLRIQYPIRELCNHVCIKDGVISDIKDEECGIMSVKNLRKIVETILINIRQGHLVDRIEEIYVCAADINHLCQDNINGIEYCFTNNSKKFKHMFDLFIMVKIRRNSKIFDYYCFCIECTEGRKYLKKQISESILSDRVSECRNISNLCNCKSHTCNGKLIILTSKKVEKEIIGILLENKILSNEVCCVIGI